MKSTKFESIKTAKGNIGVSFVSQEDADLQAEKMDKNNCNNCYNCYDCNECNDCNYCYDCYDCNYCNNCNNCNNCNYCYDCKNCYDCYDCYNCNDCTNCYDCNDCKNCNFVPRWDKTEATSLHSISGLVWPVTFSETQMQIGCQSHTIEEWKGFSEEKISSMDSRASKFWSKYKEFIFSFIALANQN